MRVALVCPYRWEATGGVQNHVRQLASHLRGRGHDTLVLAPGLAPSADPRVRKHYREAMKQRLPG